MSHNDIKEIEGRSFDLFRLNRAKQEVDICQNTLRKFNSEGLRFYRQGKCVFVSKSELTEFIRGRTGGAR